MNWMKSLFSSEKGSISSKRVCGVLGFVVILFLLVYATVTGKDIPNEVAIGTLGAVTALLGVDSVTGIWKKDGKERNDEEGDC